MPRRLNRITRMIVMVAGLVVIGGSAVGGIALAANRTDVSPSSVPHATPTRTADDQGNNPGNDNESTEDRHGDDLTGTPTSSATCDLDDDANEVSGDRHGDANAPDDDAVSGDQHEADSDRRGHDGSGPSSCH